MRKVKWMDPDKQSDLRSITEFACQYAGTMQQVQIESKRQGGPRQRLTINENGDMRAAVFAGDSGPRRQKPESETCLQLGSADAARIFSEIASFLASRMSAFSTAGAGFWEILVVDGNNRAFTGSGSFGEDIYSQRASEAIREIAGVDFDLFASAKMV